jgi:hypothetical protein
MATDESQKLDEIRNMRQHRLGLLEKRQAIEGFRTPPEIIIEIAQTRAELGMVEDVLTHPADLAMAEDLGAGGRFLALDQRIERANARSDERMDRFERAIERRLDRMEEHADARHDLQEEKHEIGAALYRTTLNRTSIIALLSLIIGIGIVFYLATGG